MSSNTARAYWITRPGHGEIRSGELPAPGRDEVLIRTAYSAVSRGTESLVFNGRVPPGEYSRMRAPFQEGDFPGPVKYGYINVGRVEQGPTALLDRDVFCLYPHQDRYIVPAHAVVPLPDDLPRERAVLAANMETALNALWDAPALLGDRITVIGAGTLGCLLARLASRIPGTDVELVDINPARETIARALGVGFALPEAARSERDLLFHTSASAAGLNRALSLAAFEAKVVELSWYGDAAVAAALGADFHARRLQLISSQVGTVAPSRRAQHTRHERMQMALRLLCDDELDSLVTGESQFNELPALMEKISQGHSDTICQRIVYD